MNQHLVWIKRRNVQTKKTTAVSFPGILGKSNCCMIIYCCFDWNNFAPSGNALEEKLINRLKKYLTAGKKAKGTVTSLISCSYSLFQVCAAGHSQAPTPFWPSTVVLCTALGSKKGEFFDFSPCPEERVERPRDSSTHSPFQKRKGEEDGEARAYRYHRQK